MIYTKADPASNVIFAIFPHASRELGMQPMKTIFVNCGNAKSVRE